MASLTKPEDPEVINAESQRSYDRSKQQMEEQRLAPMKIDRVTLIGSQHTRRSFLDPIIAPLLSPPYSTGSTIADITDALQMTSSKLDRLGIYRPSPPISLTPSAAMEGSSADPTGVYIDIMPHDLPRYKFNAGTDVGNSEGSAFTSLLWRNIFGGAEQLTLNASAGTRTRSAYSAELSAPVLSDPDRRVALELVSSATEKPWASHEEVLKGGSLRYQWVSGPRDMHSVEYSGLWRQITGLAGAASPTVRADAGDSVKSVLRYIHRREAHDNPQLPHRGYHMRSLFELAGVGPLGGDVAFSKSEFEAGAALPLAPGVSLGAGLRTGMLYPLATGFGTLANPSRVNDRFQLGGPTDVRGFKLGGLGPRDGADAVGGDLFAAASANLLFPLPYKGPDSSLRFQLFANAGRLVALKNPTGEQGDQGMAPATVAKAMYGAFGDLLGGPPSVAAGVGLVYAHPVARFELNFSLPLLRREGEIATKGVQVGVGINFL